MRNENETKPRLSFLADLCISLLLAEMESPGQWLENALVDLCKKVETGLDLDRDIISGLVSYCDLAEPLDAKEYLDNIIGQEIAKSVIEEYLLRRGHSNISSSTSDASTSKLHAYVKPSSNEQSASGVKMPFKGQKEVMGPGYQTEQKRVTMSSNPADRKKSTVSLTAESKTTHKGNQSGSKKKKSSKVVSLAEAAKGSIVFQQGKPCSCQARRHRLVSNCLSCGKIVCEQEGEGPCSFCGVLVLREGSTYAGLEDSLPLLSDAEADAEAYAKRLVEYDRNSAARTTVIDDQSDYYEIEGSSWLSPEERELLMKKQKDVDELKRSKVVVTFDLFGRKVLFNEDGISELESELRILGPQDDREVNRIKPNPSLKIQPHFVAPSTSRKPDRGKLPNKSQSNGLCLEITGRVQYESNGLKGLMKDNELTAA